MARNLALAGLLLIAMSRPGWADLRPGAPAVAESGPWRPSPLAPVVPPPPPHPPAIAQQPAAQPGLQCRRAIQGAARGAGIPDHLMSAIARVESGRPGPDGQIHPWPWSINVEGTDHIYDTREQAIAAVKEFQAQGVRSIDVGCMQVNLMYHPTAFATLEQAFDPAANAAYAARFLLELFGQTGSWPKATAAYHSSNPDLGTPYQQKVMSVLAEESRSDASFPSQIGLARGPGSSQPGFVPGMGAIMLSHHAEAARVLPQIGGSGGRGLDAYRSVPVRVAGREAP